MEKKYISIDQLWKCETCFYMGSNGKCRSDCDAVESYRPAYSKFEFADVAPVVHGEWKPNGMHPNGVVGNWKCNVCGKRSLEDSNFCPNCGAKMDEGE
jgi:hypothetical protein